MLTDHLPTTTPLLVAQFIPSPSQGVWYLGPFPVRAYAICIIVGIVIGVLISTRRWIARGGRPDSVEAVIVLAVPFGIVGARIYHVITDYEIYFGPDSPKSPIDALKIWEGGLGIWGAVALGALGAWLVARRRRIAFAALLDACAPGLVLAQAIGRIGNYFNQELFGRPTTLPWGLEIDLVHRPVGYEQFATFHPTFLYELVWNLGVFTALILLDRRFRLGHGKVFTLYVVLYTAGRFWIEALRIDTVNEIGGFRLNNYTSLIVFVVALGVLVWLVRNRPGREEVVEQWDRPAAADGSDGADAAGGADGTDGEAADGAEDDPSGPAVSPAGPDDAAHSGDDAGATAGADDEKQAGSVPSEAPTKPTS